VLTAITRAVSPGLAKCELSFISREPIDMEKARRQHGAYEQLLESLGVRVVSLPAEPSLPDSMFVEDPALVLDELAVIFPLGTPSRGPEGPALAKALSRFRKLEFISLPATLEGGDVLRVGRRLFVGRSRRSNPQGIRELARIVQPWDYQVVPVAVSGCLHLKSAVTHLGGETLLANRSWFDPAPLAGFDFIDVPDSEPQAANALALPCTVVFPTAFPKTRAGLESRGFHVTPLDISELQKAEAGLTCSSLLFDAP